MPLTYEVYCTAELMCVVYKRGKKKKHLPMFMLRTNTSSRVLGC